MGFRLLTLGVGVSRNSLINLRIFLVELVFIAEEILKVVHVIDSEVIEFDFIPTVAVGADVEFISHQRTFENAQMLDSPFRDILLCDVVLEDVEEGDFWSNRCILYGGIEEQVQLSEKKVLRHFIKRGVLTDTNEELLNFIKTILNIADFLLQFRITRIREFVILEQLFLDEETALDTV